MKFGILYNTDYYPAAHQSPSNYYAQLLEQTELAEKLGFDAVWFGEHHYSGYSFGAPSVIAMAAAARTRRIRLGTGVSLIPLHHPIRLAEEYAMLDVLSGGRLEYGIGRGFLKYSHDVFGIDDDENHERYREGTDLIVKAWTAGEPFSHEGKFWKLNNYSFFPKPLQQPYPPIYASAVLTPDSAIFAGSRGFNLASGLFLPARERVRDVIALYRQSLREHGWKPEEKEIAGVFQMYCGESQEEARRNGGQYALRYFEFFNSLDRRSQHDSESFRHHQGGMSKIFANKSYEDFEKERLMMIGEPAFLVDHIAWSREFFGINYLMMEVAQGGEPHELVKRSLKRFAERVIPAFR
jgi:alkanesulfonate monooxygenase SsuD/methylene tetrahydromethanopterin reductase-like flavin-dependent oxidoreductase (luciferase family)